MTNQATDLWQLRPTSIEIDLDALCSNYQTLKARAATARVMAVLKANAYGHGLTQCAKALEEDCGADYFGVALVEEGVRLRRAGIKTPILVFGGLFTDQVGIYLDHGLDLTASSIDKLRLIDEVARTRNVRARVHLKIDTGMGRIGVRPESAPALFDAALRCTSTDIVGAFTHFATADEADLTFTHEQLERFLAAVQPYQSKASAPLCLHAANSGALLQLPETHLDMVRAGISLFGVAPSSYLEPLVQGILKPVMRVTSRVVFFKVVKAGASVSYGRTWIASEDTRVVTIPLGYGDGYPRALSNRAEVLIRGNRYPIVGRVCMDQIMVAIGQGESYNGDEVVLVGAQNQEHIRIEELAARAGTIPYEILTALNLRIPRRYVKNGCTAAHDEVW